MSNACEACGAAHVEEGRLTSMSVQLDRAGTIAKLQAGAEVKVRVCLHCGSLSHLRADVTRLRAQVGG